VCELKLWLAGGAKQSVRLLVWSGLVCALGSKTSAREAGAVGLPLSPMLALAGCGVALVAQGSNESSYNACGVLTWTSFAAMG
jgi:hypothetical protein